MSRLFCHGRGEEDRGIAYSNSWKWSQYRLRLLSVVGLLVQVASLFPILTLLADLLPDLSLKNACIESQEYLQ